jgi:hypothetical protein
LWDGATTIPPKDTQADALKKSYGMKDFETLVETFLKADRAKKQEIMQPCFSPYVWFRSKDSGKSYFRQSVKKALIHKLYKARLKFKFEREKSMQGQGTLIPLTILSEPA